MYRVFIKFSINLPAFCHECRSRSGYATRYLFNKLFLKLGVMSIHGINITKMQLKNGVTVLVYASAGS